MALLLKVVHNAVTAELPFAEDFFNFEQIVFLKSHFEKVIGIVNLDRLELALSADGVYLVFHKERDVDRFINALKGARCLTVSTKDILEMSACGVDKSIILIEAPRLYL